MHVYRHFFKATIFTSILSEITSVLSVRPKVAELVFQLYGRSLHPELFEIYKSQTIQRGGYWAKVDITSAGHVVTWRYEGMLLTEVATSASNPLPQKRRLLNSRLKGQRSDKVDCRGGISYRTTFELETVTPELFYALQLELSRDENRSGLWHTFESSGRVTLGGLSYIHTETRARSFTVQAFHTFPDDYAVVKTQSVFELP